MTRADRDAFEPGVTKNHSVQQLSVNTAANVKSGLLPLCNQTCDGTLSVLHKLCRSGQSPAGGASEAQNTVCEVTVNRLEYGCRG